MGRLRARLPARGDREPVSVQDRPGALRSAARGDAPPRRTDAAHLCHGAGGMDGRLPASRQDAEQPKLVSDDAQPDADDSVTADAGVSGADGAGGLPPRRNERSPVAIAILLAGGLHETL